MNILLFFKNLNNKGKPNTCKKSMNLSEDYICK